MPATNFAWRFRVKTTEIRPECFCYIVCLSLDSRVSQFLFCAKHLILQSERYPAEVFFIYKAWLLVHIRPKLIAFLKNACILHDTG